MKILIYPKGWSFAATDNAVTKNNPFKFKLDRTLYIRATSFKERHSSWGIDRFICWVREWFTIDDILNGKYDGIIDEDPRNRVENPTSNAGHIITIDEIPDTMEDFARINNISPSTVQRKIKKWEIEITSEWLYIWSNKPVDSKIASLKKRLPA